MKSNIIATLVLLILDFLWIGLFMGEQYGILVPKIQSTPMRVNPISAFLAYMLMAIGLILFVVPNISKQNALQDSLMYGFLFGLVVYGVYDFTAGAVFENWDWDLAMKDILWGGFVYTVAGYSSTLV